MSNKRARFGNALEKMIWGIKTVGIFRVMRGLVRYARYRVVRPESVQIHLSRINAQLKFNYPSQLVPALVLFGDLIDPEYAFLQAAARPSWTFLDVGAAIGQFSIAAASGGGMIQAFEPSDENVRSLIRNVELNGLEKRVSVHRLAFSDQSGSAQFVTSPNTYMSHLTGQDAEESGRENVQITTLSLWCTERLISNVSVLKINTAGSEPLVLEGGDSFLKAAGADVLILLLGASSVPYYERLRAYGYRFFFFHPIHSTLHEVRTLDENALLEARPWPARHVIAIHVGAIERCTGGCRIVDTSFLPISVG